MASELKIVPPYEGRPDQEAECIQRVRGGDERAFESLFHAHYAALCRFVERYVGSPDAAEELVQQLFVRLWENRRTWFVRSALRPYLFQAARNAALNQLKHERVRRSFADRVLRLNTTPWAGQPDPGPERHHEARETAAVVGRALARLPERYREIVELRARDQMTHADIARILDLPVKTVETRARRGLQMLQRLLPPLR